MKKLALLTLLGLSLTCASTPLRKESFDEINRLCYASRECQVCNPDVACSLESLSGNQCRDDSSLYTNISKTIHFMTLPDEVNVEILLEKNPANETYAHVCLSTEYDKEEMCFSMILRKNERELWAYQTTPDQKIEELLNVSPPYCREGQEKIICPFPGLRKKGGAILGEALTRYVGISKEWLTQK